ncbi:helix-turn-helix transcriptional regulator [Pseudomonas mucidolens]|uniref:Predicted transcriptional regulator YheO, contains PAS and DNA-binding HTH domains n=1 Tax=Pseudomonas mucidolens TaxID=46679 RepID=A0A1H2MSL5_9PSED|nr:PAS domain-containing protein [Pseudomonas mucidolens]SDU95546.1 Predicted transcriptional regulator YheO, contains PAS and DNA-binding HTH domains [Pseudomonas mucidolens]SQH33405.1 YheO domain-containing protein [Pseudomonas mucidolens]
MKNIENYKVVADSIATLLFPNAEVIVHHVKSQTVVHIANNFSKRKLGDDSALDEELGDFSNASSIGPYEKINWNGQKIRSITSVLCDQDGKAEYLLCINLNFSVLEQAHLALADFFKVSRLIPQPDALFKDDWQERINTFLHAWLQDKNLSLRTLNTKDKRALVEALFAEGAFKGRSGADYVANVLNMGRATVYKYLKQLRN